MDTKKLKINIPKGYEIDRENSTFEEIVFKKIKCLPKTWEEYCSQSHGKICYYQGEEKSIRKGYSDEFSTKEKSKQYVALGKLIQLRDYWTNNWECDGDSFIVYTARFESTPIKVGRSLGTNYPLAFPTAKMAKKFKECFNDLLIEASPLL